MTFTDHEIRLLAAVCDTLIPALQVIQADDSDQGLRAFFERSASAMDIPQALAELIPQTASPATVTQLRLFLRALDQPTVNLIWGRDAFSFLEMDLDERTRILRNWAESRIPLRRRAFYALKRAALYLFYAMTDGQHPNPNWDPIGYPGPKPTAAPSERRISPLTIAQDTALSVDVVIIGSGAGGGVVAGELASAGFEVIVLDKGGYYAEADFDGEEYAGQNRMFERRGFMTNADLDMVILAGSTLGGGTTINWAAALRPPEHVLREWERVYGVTGFTGSAFQKALDSVSARINVNEDESQANARNAVLVRGAAELGYRCVPLPRNVRGCIDCGFCGFGCRYGAKQGTLRTYLQEAVDHGAKIVTNCHADRILMDRGKAQGVLASAHTPDGQTVQLTVKARAVVVAAGALHSPALLIRSGLTNVHIGRNLHLHPSSASIGVYDSPIRSWEGVMMSHYIPDFSDLDGNGYGVTLESVPAHPGLTGLSLGWLDGAAHKQLMQRYDHMANVLIIARDYHGGRITVGRDGQPIIHYKLSEYDRAHLLQGIIESLKIHQAAGAQLVYGPASLPGPHRISDDHTFDAYLSDVQRIGLRSNTFILGSAHQFSSCRMGANPAQGAIKPSGESFEAQNLYVADASVLPTATGVNPMLTIMGVAHQVAGHIQAILK